MWVRIVGIPIAGAGRFDLGHNLGQAEHLAAVPELQARQGGEYVVPAGVGHGWDLLTLVTSSVSRKSGRRRLCRSEAEFHI